ncbi:MAG: hypothetical protein KAH01_04840 [Caldisericia bacterium]|nr:hypothetical protein [Caldisericia bacterium]
MEKILISKEEWLIRLMQGMVGDYGNNPENQSECYYHNGAFISKHGNDTQAQSMDLYYVRTSDFWITDTKGIPYEPLSIINIK